MEGLKKERLHLLDGIRGLVLISMIVYHACWNMVYLYGAPWEWYKSTAAHVWQQSICWTFIVLSGFCYSLGRKHFKRGLKVFGGGLLVTIVTLAVMPHNRVVFGVLTCIGSCMLLTIPLEKCLQKIPSGVGLASVLVLFFLTRNVNRGWLGFETINLVRLPRGLYANLFTTYLGFPMPGFFSTDYFSLIPWLFLFLAGFYVYGILKTKKILEKPFMKTEFPGLSFMGRHSLLIYLLHQPVLFFAGELLF